MDRTRMIDLRWQMQRRKPAKVWTQAQFPLSPAKRMNAALLSVLAQQDREARKTARLTKQQQLARRVECQFVVNAPPWQRRVGRRQMVADEQSKSTLFQQNAEKRRLTNQQMVSEPQAQQHVLPPFRSTLFLTRCPLSDFAATR